VCGASLLVNRTTDWAALPRPGRPAPRWRPAARRPRTWAGGPSTTPSPSHARPRHRFSGSPGYFADLGS